MSALLGYGEFEQAVLLTELLFKSTNAGNAGQEKCSQSADESKRLGSVVQNLKEIKAQKEFYVNIHTLLLILATLPFTTASAKRPFSCLKHLKIYLLNILGEERLSGLAQMQLHRSGVVSPKIWEGAKMVDFRRITLFCLEKHLSKHKMAIFSKNFGGMAPLSPHWLRLCSTVLRCQIQKLC